MWVHRFHPDQEWRRHPASVFVPTTMQTKPLPSGFLRVAQRWWVAEMAGGSKGVRSKYCTGGGWERRGSGWIGSGDSLALRVSGSEGPGEEEQALKCRVFRE